MPIKLRRSKIAPKKGAMIQVPAAWVDAQKLEYELTVSNPQFWSAQKSGISTKGIESKIYLFERKGDHYLVPRHYRIPFKSSAYEERVRLAPAPYVYAHKGGVISNVEYRDGIQIDAHKALAKAGDKLLALSCGKGKTVISLKAAADEGKLPLLVVVHTNALVAQWEARIKEFWTNRDGTPVDVGRIQQAQCDWKGYTVSIAMLHTIAKKRYDPEFYNYWNLVIFDEAHRIGAQSFIAAASMFPGERWGLSATLKRPDGMDRAIKLHLGKVAYEDLSQPLVPKTFFVRTNVHLDENKYKFRGGRVNLASLTSDLAEIDQRNKLILHWIERAAATGKDRTILILGERITQLYELCEACSVSSKAVHVGAMKAADRADALTKRVVFASQQLAKEGLDRPAFDTLFILFPFGGEGRLQQSFGRILRQAPDKAQPTVMVFEDDIGIMQALARKMRRHLSKMSFPYSDVASKNGA